MFRHTFDIEYNLGKTIPSAGELLDTVNETMYGFGFPENIMAITTQTLSFTSNRELIDKELDLLREIVTKHFKDATITEETVNVKGPKNADM